MRHEKPVILSVLFFIVNQLASAQWTYEYTTDPATGLRTGKLYRDYLEDGWDDEDIGDYMITIAPGINLAEQRDDEDIGRSTIEYCDLSATNLKGANLRGISFRGGSFNSGTLEGADLSYARFFQTDFIRTNCRNANFKGVTTDAVDDTDNEWTGADFTNANFTGAYLTNVKMEIVQLEGANFTNAVMYGIDLEGLNLSGITLEGAMLDGANLRNIKSENIQGIPKSLPEGWIFAKGYLIGPSANLVGADLSGVDFKGANLNETNLDGANLDGAKFDGALSLGVTLLNRNEINKIKTQIAEGGIGGGISTEQSAAITSNTEGVNEVKNAIFIGGSSIIPALLSNDQEQRNFITANTTKINELDGILSSADETLEAFSQNLDVLNENDQSIGEQLTTLGQNDQSISEQMASLSENDQSIMAEINAMKAQLQTLVAQVAEKDERIAELEQGGGGQNLEQVRDARAGSVVLTVEPDGNNITLGLTIEQSDNLTEWTKLDGEMTRTIPIPDGKKFYRFALDK
jgi:uncharacterized protein YjbI with pentapeptide repeats